MATINAVATKAAQTQLVTVDDYLKKNEKLIRSALQNTITPERFLAITSIVMQEPALLGCTQESLVAAVLQTVQIGLTPGKVGQVYYVPFYNNQKKEVQLIIGYRGFVELINRSKEATILNAEVVYEKDQFQYEKGLNPILRHIPADGERGQMIGVYCIAKNNLANEKVFNYLQRAEIEKVKNESLRKVPTDKQQYSPWVKWEEAMWLKTAVRRIAKLLPLSTEIQQKIETDETVKTHLHTDMTVAPDKANWDVQDAEVVQQPPTEQEPGIPLSSKIEQTSVGSSQGMSSLNDVPIGQTCASFEGLVKSFKVRNGKRKSDGKPYQVTVYTVENEFGATYIIERFGETKQNLIDQVCIFKDIQVKEFKGERQYMASEVIPNEAKKEEDQWEE